MVDKRVLALGLLTLVQLTFSGWHLVGNVCLTDDINPFVFALYREFFASLLMLVLYLWLCHPGEVWKGLVYVRDTALFGEDSRLFLFLGFCSYINVMGATWALSITEPTIFAIFQPMIPCIATAISIIAQFEPFNWWKFVGIATAVAGAVTVEVWKQGGHSGTGKHYNNELGIAVICVQVTGCAFYLVFQKKILTKYHSTLVTFIYYSIGGCFTALSVAMYAIFADVSLADMRLHDQVVPWLGVSYVVLFSTLYAWNAYTYASKYLSPSISTVFMSLQPPFTALLIYIFFAQVLSTPQIIGGLFVIAGMVLTVYGGDQDEGAEDGVKVGVVESAREKQVDYGENRQQKEALLKAQRNSDVSASSV